MPKLQNYVLVSSPQCPNLAETLHRAGGYGCGHRVCPDLTGAPDERGAEGGIDEPQTLEADLENAVMVHAQGIQVSSDRMGTFSLRQHHQDRAVPDLVSAYSWAVIVALSPDTTAEMPSS